MQLGPVAAVIGGELVVERGDLALGARDLFLELLQPLLLLVELALLCLLSLSLLDPFLFCETNVLLLRADGWRLTMACLVVAVIADVLFGAPVVDVRSWYATRSRK